MSLGNYLKIGLMLFSMFFGAGNFIFPPIVGKMAGTSMWLTMAFFCVTAVALPVLGVLAVSESKGLQNLASRVDNVFAIVFTILIYLAIGPMLAIPRAGALPFEISVAPFLPASVNQQMALFVYTLIFFAVTYLLTMNPGKVLENLGKFLTPVLLALIAGLFASTLFVDLPAYTGPIGVYKEVPVLQGFLDGYNTMDALAALNFGFIVYLAIKSFGIKDDHEIAKATKICGSLAGALLIVIYFALAHLGAKSSVLFPETTNGAEILNRMSELLVGSYGALLIGSIFLLACLTTCVGLVAALSTYFTGLFQERLSYRTWAMIWTVSSMVVANFGLNAILGYSVLILNIVYPMSIVLILLAMFNRHVACNGFVYKSVVYVTIVLSVASVLATYVPALQPIVSWLPLSQYQMGWALPALAVFLVTVLTSKITKKDFGTEVYPAVAPVSEN